jgi:maltooligosyltrehalose synthase
MPLLRGERKQVTGEAWGDTRLALPSDLAAFTWHSALTGHDLQPSGGDLRLAALLTDLPVELLIGRVAA